MFFLMRSVSDRSVTLKFYPLFHSLSLTMLSYIFYFLTLVFNENGERDLESGRGRAKLGRRRDWGRECPNLSRTLNISEKPIIFAFVYIDLPDDLWNANSKAFETR